MSKRIRKICRVLMITLTAGICFTGLFAGLIRFNQFELAIIVDGEKEQFLEYGSQYAQPDAKVILRGKYLFRDGMELPDIRPQMKSNLQENKLGVYTASYEAEYFLWSAREERRICVVDTQSPVIELAQGQHSIPAGAEYEEPGYRATDNHDGDITHRVVRTEEAGRITYAVTDFSGNPAYAQRKISRFDPASPQIHLEGGTHYAITAGCVYQEPGFSATDDVDGDITEQVRVSGEVDWLTPGTYTVVYSVTDSSQNTVSVSRTVDVEGIPWPDTRWPEGNTIYLTFDDGPGPYTMQLLDVLDRYGVKATFFVVDSGYGQIMQQIVERGHSIGIHSVTHDYREIYANPEAYFADVFRMQQIIFENTGVQTTLLRFPGGGSNLISANHCEGIMTTLTSAVRDAGFQYFDWNVDSDDAGAARRAEAVRENVIRGIRETGTCIVLQHDTHGYSVDAVEEILQWGLDNGYTFRNLEKDSPGFHHEVLN